VNLLLDTHVALWAITASRRLAPAARALITADKAVVWVSAASLWEIAIEHSLGRGGMPVSAKDALKYFVGPANSVSRRRRPESTRGTSDTQLANPALELRHRRLQPA
jgi:hypothetical protein